MRFLFVVPVVAAFALPAIIMAQEAAPPAWEGLEDLHLDIIPRTEEERARIASVTAIPSDLSEAFAFEENAGGAATVRPRMNADAFSQPSANLGFDEQLDFRVGNGLFRRLWVSPPASTIASDGLGPIYNARSCQRCHLKDGRGHPPEGPDDTAVSMFLRISIPGHDAGGIAEIEDYLASLPDPTYGTQLQDFSLPGHVAEYRLGITYEEFDVALSGGEVATLRAPNYSAEDLGYGPLHPDAMLSPRVAPQMIGLGLLEAVPAEDILAWGGPR